MDYLNKLRENKIIAVIRGAKKENIIPIAEALKMGGINTLEVTAENNNVCSLIEILKRHEVGKDLIVGAGTVLDPETARAAIMSGAEFIFSPTVDVNTIRMTKRYGIISIPGAMTPTEILQAYENGGDIIKVFPANIYGPNYIKDLHGPLPQIPLMPTGGVNLNNISEYFKAGSVAVGVGGSLVDTNKLIYEEDYKQLEVKASKFIKEVKAM